MDPLNIEEVMDIIMSYIGMNQFYFIANVNKSFYKSYTNNIDIFPNNRITYYNVSTKQHTKLCYNEIITRSSSTAAASIKDQCTLFAIAAKSGNLQIVQYLHELGCAWDTRTCAMAGKFGHLDILKFARYHGCDWNDYTCINAACNGHLHIIQWAYLNGFGNNNMSIYVSSHAAENGHLHILQWLRSVNCPSDNELNFRHALANQHVDIYTWLIASSPIDDNLAQRVQETMRDSPNDESYS